MKHFFLASIILCLFLFVQKSNAQERTFGLGFMLGEPTGFSAKLWTSKNNAFDFGLGWSVIGNSNNSGSRINIHADYLWHTWDAVNSTDRIPLYFGIGGQFKDGGNEGTFLVRGVFGVAWMPLQTPIDLFLEVAPSLGISPSTSFYVNAAIGARYYF